MAQYDIRDVTFEARLRSSKRSDIFRVTLAGQQCIMKVFHPTPEGLMRMQLPDTSVDLFTRESKAYQTLAAAGLCDAGTVPRFYGTIEDINPEDALPHLEKFAANPQRPNAVLIEYIPAMHMYDLSTFHPQRSERFFAAMQDMHRCGVLHGDLYPRQMMVQTTSNRIVWLDFDQAQTFTPGKIPARWEREFTEEIELLAEFLRNLETDYRNGGIRVTRGWYYE